MSKKTINNEKDIIRKLFSYADSPVNDKSISIVLNKIYEKFEELLSLKMNELDLKYIVGKSNNDISFQMYEKLENENGSFVCSVYIDEDGNVKKTKPNISINLFENGSNLLKDESKEKRYRFINSLLKTFYHEFRHFIVFNLATNPCAYDKYVLQMAKELALFDSKSPLINKDIYFDNHDRYVIENDANISAFENDNIKDYFSAKMLLMLLSRESANIRYKNDLGLEVEEDRDVFVNSIIDNEIINKHNIDLLKRFPILLCQYTFDGRRKSLGELYLDYVNLSSKITDDNIHELYFELISNQLKYSSSEEISSLINTFGEENIYNLFSNIKKYNSNERKRKYKLVEDNKNERLKQERLEKFCLRSNGGKIKYKGCFIDYKTYISNLDESIEVKKILNNIKFRYRVPTNGFFILKNGTKISPVDYVKMFVLPLKEISEDSLANVDYENLFRSTVLSSVQMDAYLISEKLNKDLQSKNDLIDIVLNFMSNKKSINELLYGEGGGMLL